MRSVRSVCELCVPRCGGQAREADTRVTVYKKKDIVYQLKMKASRRKWFLLVYLCYLRPLLLEAWLVSNYLQWSPLSSFMEMRFYRNTVMEQLAEK